MVAPARSDRRQPRAAVAPCLASSGCGGGPTAGAGGQPADLAPDPVGERGPDRHPGSRARRAGPASRVHDLLDRLRFGVLMSTWTLFARRTPDQLRAWGGHHGLARHPYGLCAQLHLPLLPLGGRRRPRLPRRGGAGVHRLRLLRVHGGEDLRRDRCRGHPAKPAPDRPRSRTGRAFNTGILAVTVTFVVT